LCKLLDCCIHIGRIARIDFRFFLPIHGTILAQK
jgi:hypothetical protein